MGGLSSGNKSTMSKRRLCSVRPVSGTAASPASVGVSRRWRRLWRVDAAEGEVLDVLVRSKRNKHAALKLMRKLLKKYAVVPERMVTDDLRSYGAATLDLGIDHLHDRGR